MSTNHEGPGERPFYKYTSPDAALAILRSKNVRYSSPLSFNDPFDIQSGLHFDFDLSTLHGKVLDRLHELAVAPNAPPVDQEDAWGKVVLLVREHYANYGFPRERWEQLTRPLFNHLAEIIEDTQRKYQEHWRNVLLPGIRVFCVSEDKENLLMWAHYARDHTGCVFEFWSLPDEDNLLSIAQPVKYTSTPPTFFTEKEWIADLVSIKKLDTAALYRQYAYAKSSHWAYEREWRVWYPFSKSTAPHDDIPIPASELRALYIGCKASAKFSEDVITLIGQSYPMARIYRATKREDMYALQFVEA